MVLDITTGFDFDFAVATTLDDTLIFDQLPDSEKSQLRSSAAPDAIVLLSGNDNSTDNEEGRIYFGNAGNDVLIGAGGADTIAAGRDNDRIEGGTEDDLLFGNLGNDIVNGDSGNDILLGGQNEDLLRGGDGNDTLGGDRGIDTLTGEAGADIFLMAASSQQGLDTVTDFEDGVDKLQIPSNVLFSELQFANSGESTVISRNGEQLMVLNGVSSSAIDIGDFLGISPSELPDPGNSTAEARDLGVLNQTQIIQESLSSTDFQDYYSFEVNNPLFVSLLYFQTSEPEDRSFASANIELFLDANQNKSLSNSERVYTRSATLGSSIAKNVELENGQYFLIVEQNSDRNFEYEFQILNLEQEVPVENIGVLNEAREFFGEVGPSNYIDAYSFTFDVEQRLNASLNSEALLNLMSLYEDTNGDEKISSQDRLLVDSTSLDIRTTLEPGDYILTVDSAKSLADFGYQLNLVA